MADQRSFPARQTQDFVFGGEAGLPSNLRTSVGYSRPDDLRMTRKGKPLTEKQSVRPEDVSVLEEVRYDPESELASFLYLMVTGQVETGELTGESLKVEYTWVAGSEWELVHGKLKGESQYATRGPSGYQVFNLDFDCGYRSLSPSGWPRLVLTLKSPKSATEDVVRGYGCVHVPTSPGRHERKCRVFCPIAEAFWPNLKAKVMGVECAHEDAAEDIAKAEARSVTTVVNVGAVRVVLQVVQRNFIRFGYVTN